MVDVEQVEDLRNWFNPKVEVVTKLPDVRSVVEGTQLVYKNGQTLTLYIAVEGVWRIITVLT